jgi:hypothetical protein
MKHINQEPLDLEKRMGDKSKLKGYEVTGVPRSARDVVRAPVMGGGIMDSRMMYASVLKI